MGRKILQLFLSVECPVFITIIILVSIKMFQWRQKVCRLERGFKFQSSRCYPITHGWQKETVH